MSHCQVYADLACGFFFDHEYQISLLNSRHHFVAVVCKAYVHQHVPEDYMHIWLHTHNRVDTQRVPRQVTFTFALATRHVVCLHVDRRLGTGNIQLNMLQLFTVKIHSMRIHHAHHFMCVLYIRYSTPELINLAFHPDIHLQCSSHIQGIHSMSIKRCPVIKKSLCFRFRYS